MNCYGASLVLGFLTAMYALVYQIAAFCWMFVDWGMTVAWERLVCTCEERAPACPVFLSPLIVR